MREAGSPRARGTESSPTSRADSPTRSREGAQAAQPGSLSPRRRKSRRGSFDALTPEQKERRRRLLGARERRLLGKPRPAQLRVGCPWLRACPSRRAQGGGTRGRVGARLGTRRWAEIDGRGVWHFPASPLPECVLWLCARLAQARHLRLNLSSAPFPPPGGEGASAGAPSSRSSNCPRTPPARRPRRQLHQRPQRLRLRLQAAALRERNFLQLEMVRAAARQLAPARGACRERQSWSARYRQGQQRRAAPTRRCRQPMPRRPRRTIRATRQSARP